MLEGDRDPAAGLTLQPVGAILLEMPVLHHPVEREVPTEFRVERVVDRVVGLGGGEDARQRRRLRDRQASGGDSEVGLCGRLDPVCTVPEIDRVQVLREDRVLRESALDLDGHEDLADLLLHRARRDHVVPNAVVALHVPARVDALDQLLRDGRATLHGLARHEVAPRRADRPLEIHADVVVEPSVFHVDHRVTEMLRDLSERDDRPVDRSVERGEQLVVPVVDERGLDRRQRLRQIDLPVGQRERTEAEETERHGRERQGPPVPAEEPAPGALRLLRGARGSGCRLGARAAAGGRRRPGLRRLLPGVTGAVILRGSSGGGGHAGRNPTREDVVGNRPQNGKTNGLERCGLSRRRRAGAP